VGESNRDVIDKEHVEKDKKIVVIKKQHKRKKK
jgi:hypothetical protein